MRGVLSVGCSSMVRHFTMPPRPPNPHTHAHTLLTLSPFGPSFILIYEPPHGHSAAPSLHRSLKVDKKLLHARHARGGGWGDLRLLSACEGTVAASDKTFARPVQKKGCSTWLSPQGTTPSHAAEPQQGKGSSRASKTPKSICLSVHLPLHLSIDNNVRKHLSTILTAVQLVKTQTCTLAD